jgi:hypothetical protein
MLNKVYYDNLINDFVSENKILIILIKKMLSRKTSL